MKLNYSEIIKASGAEVIKNYAAQDFFSFSTDTRTTGAGQIFIPLKGESFDGENFIQTALQKEVKGYLTSDKSKIRKKDMGQKVYSLSSNLYHQRKQKRYRQASDGEQVKTPPNMQTPTEKESI